MKKIGLGLALFLISKRDLLTRNYKVIGIQNIFSLIKPVKSFGKCFSTVIKKYKRRDNICLT